MPYYAVIFKSYTEAPVPLSIKKIVTQKKFETG